MRPVPVVFHIGPLAVHTYGIGLAVTFWFAFRYFERRLRAAGYPTQWVAGVFVWVIVAAVVGARAMHVLANLSYYSRDPGQVVAVWNGGLSSWGGLLGAVPAGLFLTHRRCRSLGFGQVLDLVAPALAAAWAMGRLLGPQLMVAGGGHPTHQWFGMYYADQVGKRLPVPIFQAFEDFVIFLVLLWVERRLRRWAETRSGPLAGGGSGHACPAGVVIGAGMVLWGIERVVDEKLWLAYPGQLGDVLVEAAGVALALAGMIVLVRARGRWRGWLARARPQKDPAVPSGKDVPSAGYSAATTLPPASI